MKHATLSLLLFELSSSASAKYASAFAPRMPPAFLYSSKTRANPSPLGGGHADGSQSTGVATLPSIDEVSADDFMKQLGHAAQIVPLLHPSGDVGISDEDSAALRSVLARQFSHSDGIRGFFAVYLTSPESLLEEEVPAPLAEAVQGADSSIIVPLACMNVIMPTAMSSIHQDPELRQCALKTASNGKKILRLLKGSDDVLSNSVAISIACGDRKEGSELLVEYWKKFIVSYNYEDKQKKDIAMAMSEFF